MHNVSAVNLRTNVVVFVSFSFIRTFIDSNDVSFRALIFANVNFVPAERYTSSLSISSVSIQFSALNVYDEYLCRLCTLLL